MAGGLSHAIKKAPKQVMLPHLALYFTGFVVGRTKTLTARCTTWAFVTTHRPSNKKPVPVEDCWPRKAFKVLFRCS